MKFNIFNYSQQGAISLKLDLKDLLILDWFQTFMPRMNKIIYEQEQYYWISYERVLQDIPIIEITTEKGLYKRLQNLCDIGVLKHHTKRTNGGCYSYYLITDMIKILISPESSFANTPKVPLQSPESSQQKDSSIINSSIINNCIAMQEQSNFFSTSAEIAQVQTPNSPLSELSFESFKDFWELHLLKTPSVEGYEAEFTKFSDYWGRVKPAKKEIKYENDWRNYLKEWASRAYNIKPKVEVDKKEVGATDTLINTKNLIPCLEIPIDSPTIFTLNELMKERLMEVGSSYGLVYNLYFKRCFIVDYYWKEEESVIVVDMITNTHKAKQNIIEASYTPTLQKAIEEAFRIIKLKTKYLIEINLQIPTEGECADIKLIKKI